MKSASSTIFSILPDAVGLAILGVQVFVLLYVLILNRALSEGDFPFAYGILSYIVLAAIALYVWYGSSFTEKVSRPIQWATAIGASILLGALSFGADMIVGLISNPHLSPIKAGTRAGSPFGFPLTVMLCPGFTMVAISGFVRALFAPKESAL
jgi:hypothetical protein